MSRVVIFIPISREDHIQQLFASLEHLDCDTDDVRLMTYVDGSNLLYETAKTFTESSKFGQRVCIRRPSNGQVSHGLYERRKRISAIKNESKSLIGECEYVFGIEDDTIVPPHALSQLLADYAAYPYAGFIEGVELGRWGIPYVGGWRADDPYEPSRLESVMPGEGVEVLDAGGFYCYMTRRQHYVMVDYKPFGYNELGPDVSFGLFMRQQGFKNYIDWDINCEHRDRAGNGIVMGRHAPRQVTMVFRDDEWKQILD